MYDSSTPRPVAAAIASRRRVVVTMRSTMGWRAIVPSALAYRSTELAVVAPLNVSRTSVRDLRPDSLLGEVHHPGEDEEEDEHLETQPFALDQVRLGRPH